MAVAEKPKLTVRFCNNENREMGRDGWLTISQQLHAGAHIVSTVGLGGLGICSAKFSARVWLSLLGRSLPIKVR